MDNQRGFLMMVIAILLVIVAALASAFVAMTLSGTNSSVSSISANRAYDLAQTGIEQGTYELTLATAWCDGSWQPAVTVSGQGEYQYSCTKNTGSTTLSSAITASSTVIPLNSVSGLATFGAITVDSETIYYDGISGATLQHARRGQNGTAAAAHSSGASASQIQYIIIGQGSSPSATSPSGQVTLSQAVLLSNPSTYFAAGVNSSTSGVILKFDGSSWSTVLTGPVNFTFTGIFNTLTNGIAVGSTSASVGSIYLYNGVSWALALSGISGGGFQDVSCDTSTNCWIVGSGVSPPRGLMYRYTFPATFSYLASNNFNLLGVSCISGVCMSVGSNRAYNFSSNTTVPFNNLTSLASTMNDVDCPQTNSCVAVRSNGRVYYFNGAWTGPYTLTNNSLNSVHCPNTSLCILVGNNGVNFKCSLPITSAASCVAQTAPSSVNLLGVHCNATNDCMAVGSSSANAYHFDGTNWTSTALGGTFTLNSVTGIPGGGGAVSATPTVWRNH
ncbi:hypothetical protein [Legionella bononiensis]|uniref:Type 4 fimbrial biogenesis protein PilX N-terminal domain-containing protein n=2 Tax=Legionella bononiensis TaxID=2793102 RepID=A0ABS1WBG2_9GAMM|nr:hypothetical protein [Legionella bononiensis]MBL7526678.1 hypothetical protein [Legionella bononiensis]MBL7564085.1 hypothetical protein [Legionella bononiensis]